MNRLLLALALLLSMAVSTTTAATHHSHATRAATTTNQPVYLCVNGKSVVYHSSRDCAAMRRCSHTVRIISVSEARATGHRQCRKCP